MSLLYETDNASEALKLRKVKWSSTQLLKGITSKEITASVEIRKKVHHDLWGDMCAENDAENLWHHLGQLKLNYSEPFMNALNAWREDEQNHYIGLRQICATLYDVSEDDIDAQMKTRIPNYQDLEKFLTDEFKICVVLAYDELVSARGYTIFIEDFEQFGPKQYVTWVRRAARDEALHYQNFIDIARIVHKERLPESKEIIQEIIHYENRAKYEYNATFLLDHTEETFEREFLNSCAEMTFKALMRNDAS
jgi:hypothetical protein